MNAPSAALQRGRLSIQTVHNAAKGAAQPSTIAPHGKGHQVSYRDKYKGTADEIRARYPAAWQVPDILDSRFLDIADKAKNVTSQFGEDGLIAAILEKIGVKHQSCFEIGASDGTFFSNTKALRDQGWFADLVEPDKDDFRTLSN